MKLSPLFFIGIFCFVLPTIFNALKWHVGNWVFTVGLLFVIAGIVHTFFSGN